MTSTVENSVGELGSTKPGASTLPGEADYVYEGRLKALSSITHGGDTAGTTRMFRREKIFQYKSAPVEVPVISGNAIRGILRDYAAERLFQQLGKPPLKLSEFQALWSGGALRAASSGEMLNSHQIRDLRRLIPHIGALGVAGGGTIIEGRLAVGKAVPFCHETSHIVPVGGNNGVSFHDLLQDEEFTRMDDAKRADAHRHLEAGEGEAAAKDEQSQQMRYSFQTLAAGTMFHWWIRMVGATPLQAQVVSQALKDWLEHGAHVGGRTGSGHGRMQMLDNVYAGWASRLPLPGPDAEKPLADHVDAHRDEIREALSWLA